MVFSWARFVKPILVCVALVPMFVFAHQQQVSMTTVTFNFRTNSVEIIHRFFAHDTEHAMSIIAGNQADIMFDETVQLRFGRYVSENFQLLDQDKKALPLSLVGVEIDGDVIWVYQETPLPGQLAEITVLNSVLLDILANQVNTVNVECGKELSTLRFSGNVRAATSSIDFSACWR